MGIFLAVWSTSEETERVSRKSFLDELEQSLNFQYEKCSLFVDRESGIFLVHFVRQDPLMNLEDQTYLGDEGASRQSATLLQGYLWPKRSSSRSAEPWNAKVLNGLLRRQHVESLRDVVNGEYSVLHYDRESGLLAFNDRLSIEHIYFGVFYDTVVITNRVRLCRHVVPTLGIDLESLGWVPYLGYSVGEGTSLDRVRRLPQGAFLNVQNRELEIHENPLPMLDSGLKEGLECDVEAKIESAIEDCLSNVVVCRTFAPEAPLPLSGGKDSRAVLALILKAGQAEGLRAYTNGFEQHPDVVVATRIAAHFGLEHEVRKTKRPSEVNSTDLICKLMGSVFQTDGMLGGWDARGYWAPSNELVFAGHVGEVYRSYNTRRVPIGSLDDAIGFLSNVNLLDPAGLLRDEVRQYYRTMLKRRFEYFIAHGASFEDLPDVLYSAERIPNWVGVLRRTDGYSQRLVNPLNTEDLVKLAFALGPAERRMERIHFEIVKRGDRWLVETPFANDQWSTELEQYAGGVRIDAEKLAVPKGIPTFGSWQHELNRSSGFREVLMNLVMSVEFSPLWSIFDRQRVASLAELERFSYHQMIGFYAFMTILFFYHRMEIPMRVLLPAGTRDVGSSIECPVRAFARRTVYIYDGTVHRRTMRSWGEFVDTGLASSPVTELHSQAIRMLSERR